MFAILIHRRDGTFSARVSPDKPAAEALWASLIDKACLCAERRRLTVELTMREVETEDEEQAKAAAIAGQGHKIKGVRIHPPKQLLHKILTTGPGLVTEAILSKGQKVIDDRAEQYPAQARLDLLAMQEIVEALAAPALPEADRSALMERLFQLTYKMKGQGGTFGYPMITAVANHLYIMSKGVKVEREKLCEAIQVHLDTMQLILNRRMTGADEESKALVNGLHAIVVKMVGTTDS